MRITVLGSSGGYPAPGNPNTGFYLEHGETKIWMDAGTGTFAEIQRRVDFTKLDALFLSHAHADHCIDLFPVHVAIRWGIGGGYRLPVYCPPGLRETLAPVLMEGGWESLGEAFDFHTVDAGDTVEVGGIRFSFARMDHPILTLAMRLETDSKALTYSADTGPGADLAGFAKGSDLLICEATYQEARIGAPVHLSARQAAETARRAGARELAITHVWPTLDPQVSVREASEANGEIPVRWAGPGTTFEVD